MEAATLQKKKTSISKGKVKKSLRNIMCRPDPVFWPDVQDDHRKQLESVIQQYKVEVPVFKKPHWKEMKTIPKEQRPKAPKIPRIEGLLLGITEVTAAVQENQCSAIIIESTVNPRMIMLPLIELCTSTKVPTLCLNGLRKITSANFGIPTSCLGIKCDFLEDLKTKICEIVKFYNPPQNSKIEKIGSLEVDVNHEPETNTKVSTTCPYLYRTSKQTRVFNPSVIEPKPKKVFVGQDFIEFSNKAEQKTHSSSKTYMSMVLKKISNNQNRVKRK